MNLLKGYSNKLKSFQAEADKIFGSNFNPKSRCKKNHVFDVGIITSTMDEFDSVKNLLKDFSELEPEDNDPTIYYKSSILSNAKKLTVVLPVPYSMGLEAAVLTTTKLITCFELKYVFMVGIAAGNKKVSKIGDVLIADKALNYTQVVEIEKKDKDPVKKFMNDIYSIDRNLKGRLNIFAKSPSIKLIKEQYPKKSMICTDLNCRIGLMVTGSSLVRSDSKIEEINKSYRGVVGMDMETSGFYFALHNVLKDKIPCSVSIKSVSDYGDNSHHQLSPDARKEYALYTSSSALISFIENYIK